MDQKLEDGKLREFMMSALMDHKLEQETMNELMAKSLTNQKVNQDHGATEQFVNESGTAENGSEHAACQVNVQEKVVPTWLFDTRADAHVMPKCVCVRTVGRTYTANNKCYREERMDKTLEPWVRFKSEVSLEKNKDQITAVVARDARRCLLSGNTTQNERSHVHFESTRKFLHLTRKAAKELECHEKGTENNTLKVVCLLKRRETVGNLPYVRP